MFNDKELKLLLDLFHLYAPTEHEEPVLEFIKNVLEEYNIHYKQDYYGNICCLNHKNIPLLSAHTDCVGSLEAGGYVNLINLYDYGNDIILKGIGNIGGDDKCGVFLILLYLISGKPINAVFSVREEGSTPSGIELLLPTIENNEIFKTIPYCIVLDRKGSGDIICSQNNYGTVEFEKALAKVGKKFGYSPTKGLFCDMDYLKQYMNGCNLSVGYYNPHSDFEYVSMNDLFNTWNYLIELIETI